MGCSPPGSSVHGISQARILEWVAFPSPGDLPNPGVESKSPASSGGFFTTEPPGKPAVCKYTNKCKTTTETNATKERYTGRERLQWRA